MTTNSMGGVSNRGWLDGHPGRTEFVDLGTGESSIYILNTWENKLYVGHDMCSGAFTYTRTGKYKVWFTAMNIDGEPFPTTDWFTFVSPFVGEENSRGF